MTEKMIDDGGPALPCTDGNAGPPHGGMSTRMWLAGMAMQGMLSAFGGDPGYAPDLIDADFEPVEQISGDGDWYKLSVGWTWDTQKKKHAPHKMVTTFLQRIARDALTQADALLAESKKPKE